MSTRAFPPRLKLAIVPSRQQLGLLLLAHAAAALVLLFTDILWPWRLMALAAIAGHALYSLRGMRRPRAVRLLEYREGRYYLGLSGGEPVATELRPYVVTPWLTILQVTLAGRQRLLPLFRDSSDPDDLRQLRVLLRCR